MPSLWLWVRESFVDSHFWQYSRSCLGCVTSHVATQFECCPVVASIYGFSSCSGLHFWFLWDSFLCWSCFTFSLSSSLFVCNSSNSFFSAWTPRTIQTVCSNPPILSLIPCNISWSFQHTLTASVASILTIPALLASKTSMFCHTQPANVSKVSFSLSWDVPTTTVVSFVPALPMVFLFKQCIIFIQDTTASAVNFLTSNLIVDLHRSLCSFINNLQHQQLQMSAHLLKSWWLFFCAEILRVVA